MPLVPDKSAQYIQSITKPVQGVHGADWGGGRKSSIGRINFTQQFGSQGTGKMIALPAGKKIIFPDMCRIISTAAGSATSDLHVGHSRYVQPNGTVVAADDNAFADNIDLGGGAIDQIWTLPAIGFFVMDSLGPVDIEILIDVANGPFAGESIIVLVEFAVAGK